MWISRNIGRVQETAAAETGKVTLNSKGQVEAVSTGVDRNIQIYSPYGYSFSLPSGINMLFTKSGGEQAGIGVAMNNSGIRVGEIKIQAQSGAYIHLKRNGSVVINGLEIDRDGVLCE